MRHVNRTIRVKCARCGSEVERVNGRWLAARREAAKITQIEFARSRAHQSAASICRVEKNVRPASEKLVKLYESL